MHLSRGTCAQQPEHKNEPTSLGKRFLYWRLQRSLISRCCPGCCESAITLPSFFYKFCFFIFPSFTVNEGLLKQRTRPLIMHLLQHHEKGQPLLSKAVGFVLLLCFCFFFPSTNKFVFQNLEKLGE